MSTTSTAAVRQNYNVYLFRNVLNNSVIVSPYYRIQHTGAQAQLRLHRNQYKLRPDHWTPFAVLSGLSKFGTAKKLASKIAHARGIPAYGAGPKVQFPVKEQHVHTWSLPKQQVESTIHLCQTLLNTSALQKDLKQSERPDDVDSNGEEVEGIPLTIHWERDDTKYAIDQHSGQEELSWPEFVQHKKLELVRGRFPVVPSFDMNKMMDTYMPKEMLPVKKNRKSKYRGWQPIKFDIDPKVLAKIEEYKRANPEAVQQAEAANEAARNKTGGNFVGGHAGRNNGTRKNEPTISKALAMSYAASPKSKPVITERKAVIQIKKAVRKRNNMIKAGHRFDKKSQIPVF